MAGNDLMQQGNPEDRKLFVGGLSWDTTEQSMREYFQQFGEINYINIKTDLLSGKSRGYAFMSFASADTVNKILTVRDHIINNKKVDPKRIKAKIGKIFVGGLVPELSNDDIKAYFSQYGTIVNMEMPFDKVKNQRKGFCFISFDNERVANDILKSPKQIINGNKVDVKRVIVKPDAMGGMRGRGRGRGGRGGGSMYTGGYNTYGEYDQSGYGGGYGNYDYYGYGDYTGYDYSNYSTSQGDAGGGYRGKLQGGVRQVQRLHPY